MFTVYNNLFVFDGHPSLKYSHCTQLFLIDPYPNSRIILNIRNRVAANTRHNDNRQTRAHQINICTIIYKQVKYFKIRLVTQHTLDIRK